MSVRKVGVEEEFLLLSSDGTALAARGKDVVAAASASDDDAQFEKELKQAQAELASAPTESLSSLAAELSVLRRELATAGSAHGVRVVASGTSPTLAPARTTASRRYREMNERFGLVARQQLTCGMHIHVSVEPDEGIRVLDGIAAWLPVLAALSSNSPFYGGNDTSYASYRSILWGQWPSAGPSAGFGDRDTYDRLREDLIGVGAARDDAMIYFDARLSNNYPTVEIRVCDVCARSEDSVVIAALARALVDHAARTDAPVAPVVRPELLRAAAWRAARWGMGGELVALSGSGAAPRLLPAWDVLDELVDRIRPGLDQAGDAAAVDEGLATIRRRGTGADRQRAVYAEAGDFDAVVDELTVT